MQPGTSGMSLLTSYIPTQISFLGEYWNDLNKPQPSKHNTPGQVTEKAAVTLFPISGVYSINSHSQEWWYTSVIPYSRDRNRSIVSFPASLG